MPMKIKVEKMTLLESAQNCRYEKRQTLLSRADLSRDEVIEFVLAYFRGELSSSQVTRALDMISSVNSCIALANALKGLIGEGCISIKKVGC
jgi:hypothetical protein